MKTFQEFCEPRTSEIGAPVEIVSPTITKWAGEYGEYIRSILKAEVETALRDAALRGLDCMRPEYCDFTMQGDPEGDWFEWRFSQNIDNWGDSEVIKGSDIPSLLRYCRLKEFIAKEDRIESDGLPHPMFLSSHSEKEQAQ